MMLRVGAAILFLLTAVTTVTAEPTVIVVRHTQRVAAVNSGQAMTASDPELSPDGVARAETLARMLRDAKITAIFTTEFKRTKQTAAPLATLLGIEPVVVGSKDISGLAAKISAAKGNVFVVGHSNTVPEVLKALGVTEPVTIADTEFDNLFVVQRGTLLRLRY